MQLKFKKHTLSGIREKTMTQTETRYWHNETVTSLTNIKSNLHILYCEKFLLARVQSCKPTNLATLNWMKIVKKN